mmetsp:Transcript_101240/g.179850  ORF Transcript_101240/g.179850 Transcript_101240/m.179850 type:complete len:327 (+) Transcript_101240:83-1063(+)
MIKTKPRKKNALDDQFDRVLHMHRIGDKSDGKPVRPSSPTTMTSPFAALREHKAPERRLPSVGHMEPKEQIIGRVRRLLMGAKARSRQSWDDIFHTMDKDRSGKLDLPEMIHGVRHQLNIPPQALPDHELKLLMSGLDSDRSGHVDAHEFYEYVSHGPQDPEKAAALMELKRSRVKRNVQLAFRRNGTSEPAISKLFQRADQCGDGKISWNEFLMFVRIDLQLSYWDVPNSELKVFFKSLDKHDDGVDLMDIVSFVQDAAQDLNSREGMSLMQGSKNQKGSTFRQNLLRKQGVLAEQSTSSFMNVGRSKPAIVREAMVSAVMRKTC